ncbi:zinc metalloprotease [Emticicia fontis]
MKKLRLFFLLLAGVAAQAQTKICGTYGKGKPIIFSQQTKDSLKLTNAINTPYTVKVYITVFADDNGGNRADTDARIAGYMQVMSNVFQSHNICFLMAGMKQVNNTDLNTQNVDTEESELAPYMESGFLNIFVHRSLPGYSGYAYAIPNTYLSIVGNLGVDAILAHEMGHCLGLYHTFEPWNDNNGNPTNKENVARSGNCENCTTAGDVLCDTPADDNGGVNALCVYTGIGKDACNASYSPMTNNVMGYGNFACNDTFTAGQGDRMRTFLTTNNSLKAFTLHDILYTPVFGNVTISSGTGYTLARDLVYISDGNSNLTVNGTAKQFYQAKKVLVKSGTKFSPAASGKVSVKSNPYCN